MARNDRTVRLEALKQALIASHSGVSVKQLAARHGWKERAIYRDIEVLRDTGYNVVSENGRLRIDGKSQGLVGRPDADERLALYLAREQARGWGATSLGKALDRLWHRVSVAGDGQTALLPVDSVPWLTARDWTPVEHARYRRVVSAIETGVREHRVLRISYRALSTGILTEREVEPGQLHWDQRLGSLYLIAFCRLRAAVRVFAAHRIHAAEPLAERCPPRPETRSNRALKGAFRVWSSAALYTIRVQFTNRAADEIRERTWIPEQRLTEVPGGVVLEAQVAGLVEIERWLLGYGADARALAPPELVERVAAKLHAAAAAYGKKRIPPVPAQRPQRRTSL